MKYLAVLIIPIFVSVITTAKADSKNNTTRTLMRQKLALSQNILEGLVTSDFKKIVKNAKSIKDVHSAVRWHKFTDPQFMRYSDNFGNSLDNLIGASNDGNREAILLGYVRFSLGCVECHHFVRDKQKQGKKY